MAQPTTSYLGNQNLKRAGVQLQFTQDQVHEIIKCTSDICYFIENYIKIVNVDLGLITFKLREYQREIVTASHDNRFVICKLPRQAGKTTAMVGVILWHVLFNSTFKVAVLAHKEEQSIEILDRVKLAYEHLPLWLQQGILEWNKKSIDLENGSSVMASSTSSAAIRGTSQNLVYLDEFAYVPNNIQESFFASVYPTITSGKTTKVLITSTPNGLNLFYKLWVDSEQGRNDYKRVDVHWSQVPMPGDESKLRDLIWKEETIRNTSAHQFRVEFETEFVGSTSTLIDPNILRRLVYIYPEESKDSYSIYSAPAQDRLYMITVDTARGTGLDYSVFIVFDITAVPYKVAAVYRNNEISPFLFPNIVESAAKAYNNCPVLVESNDIGQTIASTLYRDLEYENVLFTKSLGHQNFEISLGFGASTEIGIRTTKLVKKLGCSGLKSLIEMDKLIINDYNILQELYTFSLNNKDQFEAEEGKNDDTVMCCVLLGWIVDQPYFNELTSQNYRQMVVEENKKKIEEEFIMFGVISGGTEELIEEQGVVIDLETGARVQLAVNKDDDSWLL